MSISCLRPHSPDRRDRPACGQSRLEGLVDEEPPDLFEGNAADELLDVDPPIPQGAALAIGFGDLGLEGDDALEPRPHLGFRVAHSGPSRSIS
jgi:hypothetical protein